MSQMNNFALDYLNVKKILMTEEGEALVEAVGYEEAFSAVSRQYYKDYAKAVAMVYPAMVAVVIGAAAALGVGIAGAGVGASAIASGASGASAASSVASGTLTNSNIISLVRTGISSATLALTINRLLGQGDQTTENEIRTLGKYTDEKLYELGFNAEQINVIRDSYQQIVFGTSNGYNAQQPIEPNDEPVKLTQFLTLYDRLVSQGVDAGDALRQVAQSMQWNPPAEIVTQLYNMTTQEAKRVANNAQIAQQTAQNDQLWTDYVRSHTEITNQYQLENLAYQSLFNSWKVEDRQYDLQVQRYTLGTQDYTVQNRFYETYDNLRSRGLAPDEAMEEATRITGYTPSELTQNALHQDLANYLSEFIGAYQTSDVYEMIQTEINNKLQSGAPDSGEHAYLYTTPPITSNSEETTTTYHQPEDDWDMSYFAKTQKREKTNMSYRRRGFSASNRASYIAGLRAGRRSSSGYGRFRRSRRF